MKPWITPTLLRHMRDRDKLQKKLKKNPESEELIAKFKKRRNTCNALLKKAKREYEEHQLNLAIEIDKKINSPLKSRELYCELCDVQLSSKVHAESHYSGKPHRAVVEGRRKPRNTLLNQENMRVRLQQLIRREKKHLKIKEPKEAAASSEPKVIPPELYCNICKTSVTCSEQMTIHLNGRRHLSKEKQHILKTMRGEPTDDTSAANEDGDDNDTDDGEDTENNEDAADGGDTGDDPKSDDWENGEPWEDSETAKMTW